MDLKIIDILKIKSIEEISFPCVIDLGSVFGIIDLPTFNGVKRLDMAKNRLPGKHYGSISSISKIPDHLKHLPSDFFCNSFIRQKITKKNINNPLIKNGTHQTLFLGNSLNDFFYNCEQFIKKNIKKDELIHPLVSSVICSSANISGDSNGSITSYDIALNFCHHQKITTLIKNESGDVNSSKGSFPILEINKKNYKVHRAGPDLIQKCEYLNSIGLVEIV